MQLSSAFNPPNPEMGRIQKPIYIFRAQTTSNLYLDADALHALKSSQLGDMGGFDAAPGQVQFSALGEALLQERREVIPAAGLMLVAMGLRHLQEFPLMKFRDWNIMSPVPTPNKDVFCNFQHRGSVLNAQ